MKEDTAAKPLTPKQDAFCREYLIDLNATAAAIRAGYSEKGATVRGSELLANRNVSTRLRELQGARAERASMDAQAVIEGLLREAKGEGPDSNSPARIRAWELVGKHIGMWKESKDDSRRSGLDDLIDNMAALRAKRSNQA